MSFQKTGQPKTPTVAELFSFAKNVEPVSAADEELSQAEIVETSDESLAEFSNENEYLPGHNSEADFGGRPLPPPVVIEPEPAPPIFPVPVPNEIHTSQLESLKNGRVNARIRLSQAAQPIRDNVVIPNMKVDKVGDYVTNVLLAAQASAQAYEDEAKQKATELMVRAELQHEALIAQALVERQTILDQAHHLLNQRIQHIHGLVDKMINVAEYAAGNLQSPVEAERVRQSTVNIVDRLVESAEDAIDYMQKFPEGGDK